ncbi:hypothetical protein Hanom_Chr13g01242001 [Helianthus anomalus]
MGVFFRPTRRIIRSYKMIELPFSLINYNGNGETFLDPQMKNKTFGLNWQNDTNHRD